MTAITKLRQETLQQAIYDVTVFAPVPCTLSFSVTQDGFLGFDNRQPNAKACLNRAVSRLLAAEMSRTACERVPGALKGRSLRGLAFELRVHNRAFRLGLFRSHSVTTELGGLDAFAPGYDHNAIWFEHPFRCIPAILRALITGNI